MTEIFGNNIFEKFTRVKAFVFDVDGVMTDSSLFVNEDGSLTKLMNVKDGFAIKKAIAEGYNICIITGGKSIGTAKRFHNLGVNHVFIAAEEKIPYFEDFLAETGLKKTEILYMGDDLPDYQIMKIVGVPTCPHDAVPEIIAISDYVSPFSGGKGCVRDVIEKVLKIQGKWTY
ncbi:MAG: HAD-IIIA family hydrolase [Saprospiraceae bacterium]|nr:HAD-IIIA family hydrolase [Saprospiraceae bacterium]